MLSYNFRDIEPTKLGLIDTKISDLTIEPVYDQSKRNYLHPDERSEAEKFGTGSFITEK